MAFPSDISLPANARYYTFIETKKQFNANYDITWSFQYKLPSTSIPDSQNYQLGFSTFLTNLTSAPETWMPGLPGQYLGDRDPAFVLSASCLLTEAAECLQAEDAENILIESPYSGTGLLVKVAFDSTGLYAITGRDFRPGVDWAGVSRQSLVVREANAAVKANVPLASLSTSFSTLSTDTYRTLRFRYANLGRQIHIDFRDDSTTTYTALTTIHLSTRQPTDQFNLSSVFCGFSLSTPISTGSDSLSAKDFFLRDFHVEGFEGEQLPTETVVTPSLSVNPHLTYTTVTNITA